MFDNQLIADTELLADWPLDSDWSTSLADFFQSSHCTALSDFVCSQREQHEIYPPAEDVFNAFRYCSLADTNVVILGQDPYHGPGQAHGLCFSVPSGIKAPPSLRNIFVELNSDLDIDNQGNTDLTLWARQGVLLLNTVLTVQAGSANSHRKRGWEEFTNLVIEKVAEKVDPVIFVLWGKPAASKAKLVPEHHKIIESPHPSPLSSYRGFFGSKPFSTINSHLRELGKSPIDWQL